MALDEDVVVSIGILIVIGVIVWEFSGGTPSGGGATSCKSNDPTECWDGTTNTWGGVPAFQLFDKDFLGDTFQKDPRVAKAMAVSSQAMTEAIAQEYLNIGQKGDLLTMLGESADDLAATWKARPAGSCNSGVLLKNGSNLCFPVTPIGWGVVSMCEQGNPYGMGAACLYAPNRPAAAGPSAHPWMEQYVKGNCEGSGLSPTCYSCDPQFTCIDTATG
jgi:hypothetical protein